LVTRIIVITSNFSSLIQILELDTHGSMFKFYVLFCFLLLVSIQFPIISSTHPHPTTSKGILQILFLVDFKVGFLNIGYTKVTSYRNILQHNCESENWSGQYEEKLLVDEMIPRSGRSIVVINSPTNIVKCGSEGVLRH
jgi:hypothetical protein